ncbi:hypothetical protein GAY28_24860 [Azospirillum brasilense]|nr:hypothetical protein [Azospirillum brasilense]
MFPMPLMVGFAEYVKDMLTTLVGGSMSGFVASITLWAAVQWGTYSAKRFLGLNIDVPGVSSLGRFLASAPVFAVMGVSGGLLVAARQGGLVSGTTVAIADDLLVFILTVTFGVSVANAHKQGDRASLMSLRFALNVLAGLFAYTAAMWAASAFGYSIGVAYTAVAAAYVSTIAWLHELVMVIVQIATALLYIAAGLLVIALGGGGAPQASSNVSIGNDHVLAYDEYGQAIRTQTEYSDYLRRQEQKHEDNIRASEEFWK